MTAQWPGFVVMPCTHCNHPGDHHQPVCIATTARNGRPEFCGCPAYHANAPQQVGLFDNHGAEET